MVLRLSRGRVGSRLFKVDPCGSTFFLCVDFRAQERSRIAVRSVCGSSSARGREHEGLETAVAALFGECIPSARLLLSGGRQPVLGILSIEDKAIVRFL